MKTLTFKKLILLVVLIGGYCALYGATSEVQKISIGPSKELYPQHTKGDWDFMGNGPHVVAKADAYISQDKSQIRVKLYLLEQETKSDWTTFEQTWDGAVWKVRSGCTIEKINSALSSSAEYTDRNHELRFPQVKGKLVERFEIMGDQFGNDHPFMNVFYNEMSVTIKCEN